MVDILLVFEDNIKGGFYNVFIEVVNVECGEGYGLV